jgi:hypothetical protein
MLLVRFAEALVMAMVQASNAASMDTIEAYRDGSGGSFYDLVCTPSMQFRFVTEPVACRVSTSVCEPLLHIRLQLCVVDTGGRLHPQGIHWRRRGHG